VKLTVTIRDDSPMLHCGDSPAYRSVQIEFTPEQIAKIKLRHKEEDFSRCWIEPEPVTGDAPTEKK
jgi:hypothetical protein